MLEVKVWFLVISTSLFCSVLSAKLTLDPPFLNFEVGANVSFTAKLENDNLTKNYQIPITVDMDGIILSSSQLDFTFETGKNLSEIQISLTSTKCGTAVISAKSSHLSGQDNAFIRVGVFRSQQMKSTATIFGWIYFTAWTISFYPQIFMNYRSKSVIGFNFDFIALNFVGHFFYMIFNCGFYWIPIPEHIYSAKHPHGVNPVELNDVLFSIHAVFATIFQIIQCFIYKAGGQKISNLCFGIILLMTISVIICLILTSLGRDIMKNIDFLLVFSYIALIITFIKYCPQTYAIYERQSTKGFSVLFSIFDCIGGLMSMLQVFVICYNFDDWNLLSADINKVGLGILSTTFGLIVIIQHFVLYRNNSPVRMVSNNGNKAFEGSVIHM